MTQAGWQKLCLLALLKHIGSSQVRAPSLEEKKRKSLGRFKLERWTCEELGEEENMGNGDFLYHAFPSIFIH